MGGIKIVPYDFLTRIMENFAQKSFRKGFSCKPTWMWASIRDDTRKSSFSAVDYFFLSSGTNIVKKGLQFEERWV